jgi:hypothetical protein
MKIFKTIAIVSLTLLLTNFKPMKQPKMFKPITNYLNSVEREFDQIPEERRAVLEELGEFIFQNIKKGENAKLTVICTHNSRRSHMGQLWLAAAAVYYGIDGVITYSGGTEATAFNPRAVAAMKIAGFRIRKVEGGENPNYEAFLGRELPTIPMFSKKFDNQVNPQKGFGAVMVCSDADAACPIVPGADGRFSVPFEDPKKFDNTAYETHAYNERCRQIAKEMLFVMHYAKQLIESK